MYCKFSRTTSTTNTVYLQSRRLVIYLLAICLALLLTACSDPTPQINRLADDAVILAFGDSLTFGTGANKNESYPVVLENQIKRKVINAGMPGELSVQGLKRLPEFLEKYKPALLILCHGGNDILRKEDMAEAESNIREMILLAKNKNIPVILLGVPKPGLFLNTEQLYTNIAETTDVIFVPNLISEILSDASMKSDPVHPNRKGYTEMASALATTLHESGAI